MEDKKCMISVQNVTMTFRKEEDFSGSLKETVTKLFSGRMKFTKFTALRDLSFNVYQGETVGLIGRNGAGKSTTLKIISGIMKPTSGTVVRNGNILSGYVSTILITAAGTVLSMASMIRR